MLFDKHIDWRSFQSFINKKLNKVAEAKRELTYDEFLMLESTLVNKVLPGWLWYKLIRYGSKQNV